MLKKLSGRMHHVITGFADLLTMQEGLPAEVAEYLGHMVRSSRQLAEMWNNVQDYARLEEARQKLALLSALPGTEEPLWKTLEVSYFARHDAGDIAWHARSLWRHIQTQQPVVSARPSTVGDGLQVLVYSPDRPDLFARICGYFDSAGFSIQDAKVHTTRAGYALDTFQVINSRVETDDAAGYRSLISLVETQAALALASDGPLPEPARGRVSRRVRSSGGAAGHAGVRRTRAALAADGHRQRSPGLLYDRARARNAAQPIHDAAGQQACPAATQGAAAHRERSMPEPPG
jgi:hypothetical protein